MHNGKIYFISHPEVIIDKKVPVPQWDLSETGLQRLQAMLTQPWVESINHVFSSNERKAITTADILAAHLGKNIGRIEDLGEMDRSATGMLEQPEFSQVVEQFFAKPEESIRGWERAVDAQSRILKAVEIAEGGILATDNIALVSHGGVGSLLLSYLKGTKITRTDDQPSQGHYFVFARNTKQIIHAWKAIDDLTIEN